MIPIQESLHDCGHDEQNYCPGSGSLDVAAVVCVDEQADLEPDIYDLMSSAHLEDKQLFFLQVKLTIVTPLAPSKSVQEKSLTVILVKVTQYRAIWLQ